MSRRSAQSGEDRAMARQARRAAIVMVATMVLWMGGQAAGAALDWPVRFVFLFDFAALAGLFWALFVTYQIWRARRSAGPGGGT